MMKIKRGNKKNSIEKICHSKTIKKQFKTMYKNFNLTDEERQQILEQHQGKGYKQPLSEQPQLASVNTTRFATGFGADKMAALEKLALQNGLIKQGEKISDYFTGKDGLPTVTDLPDVTVSAKRGPAPAIANAKDIPLPQVKAPVQGIQGGAPTQGVPSGISATKQPDAAGSKTGADATGKVDSGPTNPASQGQQIHNMLMQKGLINGFADANGYENRRIVYKGAPLAQQQITTLTDYLVSKGYGRRFSQVGDKRYGQKLVWVKGGGTPTEADLAA